MAIKGKFTFFGWLHNIPWLSLALLWLSYAVFGWLVSKSIPFWIDWLSAEDQIFNGHLSASAIAWGVKVISAAFVLLLAIALIAPIRLIRFCFASWLRLDKKAFGSILFWAFLFVLCVSFLEKSLGLFLLIASGLLARLNLQTAGYNPWQSLFILAFVSLGGFVFGLIAVLEL